MEHDRLVGDAAQQVATVVYLNREKPVLGSRARSMLTSAEAHLELHARADSQHRPARGDHRVPEPVELGGIAKCPRRGRAAQDDAARTCQALWIDGLVVGDLDGLAVGRHGEPLAESLEVLRPCFVQLGETLGEDELDGHGATTEALL